MTSLSALGAARLGVGLAETVLPDRVGTLVLGHTPDTTERVVLRILGARHLFQLVAARRGHEVLGGPLLDALHAASMYGAAAVSDKRRRAALTSAVAATAFAVAAWRSPRV
jgi:NAD(P)H-hydrate repair Nnr-like enzyme with NAD(P)H-hydrate dehydratase domain